MQVTKAREIAVTSRGKVIARIVVGRELWREARDRLRAIRRHCTVGDLVKPSGYRWDAER